MFKRVNLVMAISEAVDLDLRAASALFAALRDVYVPAERRLHVGDATMHVGTSELWPGEEDAGDGVTRFDPARAVEVIGELPPATRFFLSTDGATFHRRIGERAPAWFGRWAPAGHDLDPIARVLFVHDSHTFEVEVQLPLDGYPIMARRLTPEYRLFEGDLAIAAENRERWFIALDRMRSAMGLATGDVVWHEMGDAARREPADEADLTRWLARLQVGL